MKIISDLLRLVSASRLLARSHAIELVVGEAANLPTPVDGHGDVPHMVVVRLAHPRIGILDPRDLARAVEVVAELMGHSVIDHLELAVRVVAIDRAGVPDVSQAKFVHSFTATTRSPSKERSV